MATLELGAGIRFKAVDSLPYRMTGTLFLGALSLQTLKISRPYHLGLD